MINMLSGSSDQILLKGSSLRKTLKKSQKSSVVASFSPKTKFDLKWSCSVEVTDRAKNERRLACNPSARGLSACSTKDTQT